jgi:hypothetical protein
VALEREGFCDDDVNDGPDQEYVAPVTDDALKLSVEPAQTGELLEAVGVAGEGFTLTTVVPTSDVHPPTVTVRLYVPASAKVTPVIDGLKAVEAKDDGPVQE